MITNLQHTTEDHSLIWAISDGRPGNARQAQALAQSLLPGRVKTLHVNPRAPWRWASPCRLPGNGYAFDAAFTALMQQPPPWVVGCGRQAALATRLLREAGSQVVQILDPRISQQHWDWLVIPEHDRIIGINVIQVHGSLNPVDDLWLEAARGEFAWLSQFPGPRLTVLVGGDSRHGRLSAGVGQQLLDMMEHWHLDTGGSVLLTTSRRTPPALVDELAARMQMFPGVCWSSPDDGPNPYPGFLAFSDQIVCSADSVNLLSEACATRAPVCVVGIETAKGGPGRFARRLLDSGRVQTSLARATSSMTPLRETPRIAAIIRTQAALPSGDT